MYVYNIGNFLQFYHAWSCLIFSFLDDENKKPKIKVEIKPISAIQKADVSTGSSSSFSASVDELRSAVVGLEIAPSIGVSEMLSKFSVKNIQAYWPWALTSAKESYFVFYLK